MNTWKNKVGVVVIALLACGAVKAETFNFSNWKGTTEEAWQMLKSLNSAVKISENNQQNVIDKFKAFRDAFICMVFDDNPGTDDMFVKNSSKQVYGYSRRDLYNKSKTIFCIKEAEWKGLDDDAIYKKIDGLRAALDKKIADAEAATAKKVNQPKKAGK